MGPGRDRVYEPVLHDEFRLLKAFGERFAGCLLDDKMCIRDRWYACSLGKLAENFRRKHFAGSGCMLQRRHGRYAFAHQVAVDRRRRTE